MDIINHGLDKISCPSLASIGAIIVCVSYNMYMRGNGCRVNIDLSSVEALEASVRELVLGETVREVASYAPDAEKVNKLLTSIKHKGNIGNIVEEALGLKVNSDPSPDFKELGVELKATPVEDGKKQEWKAGERLVITMISYLPKDNEIDGRNKRFEETHLSQKLARILLCVYKRPSNHKGLDRGDFPFCQVTMFTVPAEDMPTIRQDWEDIMSYVYQGRANELSESLTKYLGACTKGADGSSMKRQGYPPFSLAKPRAFCLKTSYMTYLQNNYIMADRDTYVRSERIGGDFESVAIKRMSRFIGMADHEISKSFGYEMSGKSNWANLSFRMLGIRSNRCEEFLKANIVVKTLRFEPSGVLKESISLPVSDFLSVFEEESFEDYALYEYFENTRFLLSIWRKEKVGDSEICRFVGAGFWGMNGNDIYGGLQDCWMRTKEKLTNGVRLTPIFSPDGKVRVSNDLPGMGDPGSIAHVRPHTNVSYHVIKGRVYANKYTAGPQNAFELPNGDWMTKQSFWLNHDYMAYVIRSLGIRIRK